MGTSPARLSLPITDAHVHLYDSATIPHAVFSAKDPGFEALVGDYSTLPPTYTLQDYLTAAQSREVEACRDGYYEYSEAGY